MWMQKIRRTHVALIWVGFIVFFNPSGNSLYGQAATLTVTMVVRPSQSATTVSTLIAGIVTPGTSCDTAAVTLGCDDLQETTRVAVLGETWSAVFMHGIEQCQDSFFVTAKCFQSDTRVAPDPLVTPAIPVDLELNYISAQNSTQGKVNISWHPNPENDIRGYRIHYGTAPGQYTFTQYTGNVTNYFIDNLDINWKWYFAVTALDLAGNESSFSDEVATLVEANVLPEAIDIIDISWRQPTTFDSTLFWVKGLNVDFPWTSIASIKESSEFKYVFPSPGTYKFVLATWHQGRENNQFSNVEFLVNKPETNFKITLK